MTAETLKPFIAPTSAVNHFPAKPTHVTHSKRNPRQLIAIILGVIGLVLVAGILTLTIWQTIRVRQLDSDLCALQREVNSLRQRLGINYLEDIAEFQKEYTNLLIHDPSKLDDIEAEGEEDEDDDDDDASDGGEDDGDDDDDALTWLDTDDEDEDALSNARLDYTDYLDMIKKEQEDSLSTENEEVDEVASTATTLASSSFIPSSSVSSTSSASNDDNVFDDFTSYNDSKKKRERKARSIAEMRNEVQSNDLAQNRNNDSRTDQKLKDSPANSGGATVHHRHVHRLRPRTRKSRQRLLVRRGESPVSAKSADLHATRRSTLTPAAHFHLNSKVPQHKSIKLNSYDGDMYMGHATASSDNRWQQDFIIDNGVLTVQQPGLYYVYAQICYNNTHDQNGFIIFHGQHPFLQCLNTVPTNMPQKVHTCHTSGLIQLQEKESIHLRDIHQHRNVILRDANNRSFFGIIKL